jgi:hypothetical protein
MKNEYLYNHLYNYTQPDFSVAAGISLQQQQLSQWASVLTADAFHKLYQLVTKDNDKAKSGYDVVRGQSIDTILHNQVMR